MRCRLLAYTWFLLMDLKKEMKQFNFDGNTEDRQYDYKVNIEWAK